MWVPFKSFRNKARSGTSNIRIQARVSPVSTWPNSWKQRRWRVGASTTNGQRSSMRNFNSAIEIPNKENDPTRSWMCPRASTCQPKPWSLMHNVWVMLLSGTLGSPPATSANTCSTRSGHPQSRVRRRVCNKAHPWGSKSMDSTRPKWTAGFAPAASARRPLMAPDLRVAYVAVLSDVAATPCNAFGHAAQRMARNFWE